MKKESTKEKSVPLKVINEEKQSLLYRRVDPFDLVSKDGKVIIVFGNSLVSQLEFDSFDEAENYLNKKPYEIIFATCCAIMRNLK